MRSRAFSIRDNSRLSTSANWELISSWTGIKAASTTSPTGLSPQFLKQTQVAGQGPAKRIAALIRT